MSPSAAGRIAAADADGTHTSVGHPTQSPLKSAGATPTTMNRVPFSWMSRPMASLDWPKRLAQ